MKLKKYVDKSKQGVNNSIKFPAKKRLLIIQQNNFVLVVAGKQKIGTTTLCYSSVADGKIAALRNKGL